MHRSSYDYIYKRKRKPRYFLKTILVCAFIIIFAIGTGVNNKNNTDMTIEVSTIDEVEDTTDIYILNEETVDNKENASIFKTVAKLFKRDKIPPILSLKPVSIYSYQSVKIQDFIEDIQDETECKFTYISSPNLDIVGEQEIIIEAKDSSNNVTIEKTTLTIKKDTKPPVISGVVDKFVYIGDTIAYKEGITAIDDIDGTLEISVDNSKVDLKHVGVYPITYTAQDKSGNITSVTMNLNVVKKPASGVQINEVFKLADDVLARITTENMSKLEKARAIFYWVKSNVAYSKNSSKESWITGAYTGFIYRKGDCFISFATSKALLIRADIDNLDIREINGRHYWNLINCGDGWYHFDTTVFQEPVDVFMWTDEKVDSLYITGYKLHTWDRTIVPKSG